MGFKIRVNGEEVWESDGDAILVNELSASTSQGEFARLGAAPGIDSMDIFVNIRNEVERGSDLDVVTTLGARRRSEELERELADFNAGNEDNPRSSVGSAAFLNRSLEDSRTGAATAPDSTSEATAEGVDTTGQGGEGSEDQVSASDEENNENASLTLW